MLVDDATDHRRGKRTVGKRPVGDGKSSIIGSYESSGNQEKNRPQHHKHGEAVHSGIVGRGHVLSPRFSGIIPQGSMARLRETSHPRVEEECGPGFSAAIPTARNTRSLRVSIKRGESPTAGIMRNVS